MVVVHVVVVEPLIAQHLHPVQILQNGVNLLEHGLLRLRIARILAHVNQSNKSTVVPLGNTALVLMGIL